MSGGERRSGGREKSQNNRKRRGWKCVKDERKGAKREGSK